MTAKPANTASEAGPHDASPMRPLGIATTSGILLGFAAHIALNNANWGLGTFLRDAAMHPHPSTRSAAAWWLLAATSFIVAGLTVALVSRPRLRRLMIWAGIAAIAALAIAASGPHVPAGPTVGLSLALHLAAGVLVTLMAFAGAYIGVRLSQRGAP